jgi:hypothetical protein
MGGWSRALGVLGLAVAGCGEPCLERTLYLDSDGDGFGQRAQVVCAVEVPAKLVEVDGDCHDDDALAHPGAFERCNGQDDDCDGRVDEDLGGPWYLDADQDGWGDSATQQQACAPGYASRGGDCDDFHVDRHPAAVEVCDGVDNDCDGTTDELGAPHFADLDGDGYGDPAAPVFDCSGVANALDCDDADADVYPGAEERSNLVDDDCDGAVDEHDPPCFLDEDGDGWGDATAPDAPCGPWNTPSWATATTATRS